MNSSKSALYSVCIYFVDNFKCVLTFLYGSVLLLQKYVVSIEELKINVWLKYNSGMNRFGFNFEELIQYYNLFCIELGLKRKFRLISHLACSDVPENEYNEYNDFQIKNFENCSNQLDILTALFASGGYLLNSSTKNDYSSIGLLLYGISPFDYKLSLESDFKPVMKFTANLIAVNFVTEGSKLGYGDAWLCPSDAYIGIICVGYADGYPRNIKDGFVSINDQVYPVDGSVNMDIITVNLGRNNRFTVGEVVSLWGDSKIPLESVALKSNRIPYDLISGVTKRVNRVYI
jgi:alanine racemase